MKMTIWMKGGTTKMYVGGDPEKQEIPLIAAEIKDIQILIEPDKRTVTVLETK